MEDPVALEVLVALEGDLEDGLCAVVKCARSVWKKLHISTTKKLIRYEGSSRKELRLSRVVALAFVLNINALLEERFRGRGR